MITKFVAGKYYRCSLLKRPFSWNKDGAMDFMLDGKWHKCKETSGDKYASFYDSPNPEYEWIWNGLDYFEEKDDYLSLKDELAVLLKQHTPQELIKLILILAKEEK